MEGEGEETVWTGELETTGFADCQRCGAAAVVINQGLIAVFEVFFDFLNERVAEVAIRSELVAVFEVDNLDVWFDGGIFGFFVERNKGIMGACEVVIFDFWGGGAEEAGDFGGSSDEAGEADGGVFWGLILEIG